MSNHYGLAQSISQHMAQHLPIRSCYMHNRLKIVEHTGVRTPALLEGEAVLSAVNYGLHNYLQSHN